MALASLFAPSVVEGAALVRDQSSAQTERIDMSMYTDAQRQICTETTAFFFFSLPSCSNVVLADTRAHKNVGLTRVAVGVTLILVLIPASLD